MKTKKYFAILTSIIVVIAWLIWLSEKISDWECWYFLEECQDEIQEIENWVEILENNVNEFTN